MKFLLALGLFCAGLIGFFAWETYQWAQYRAAHHCMAISSRLEHGWMWVTTDGRTGAGYMLPTEYTITTFQCDGGEKIDL